MSSAKRWFGYVKISSAALRLSEQNRTWQRDFSRCKLSFVTTITDFFKTSSNVYVAQWRFFFFDVLGGPIRSGAASNDLDIVVCVYHEMRQNSYDAIGYYSCDVIIENPCDVIFCDVISSFNTFSISSFVSQKSNFVHLFLGSSQFSSIRSKLKKN